MISSGVLSSAVSGLIANSARVARAADNIVNVSTTGYKAGDVQTITQATGQTFGTGYAAGGVQTISRYGNAVQGLLQSTGSTTDLAISGNGYFAVAPNSSATSVSYTRSGSFRPDNAGYLVNTSGQYLLGYPVDANGATNTTSLGAVNIHQVASTADATNGLSLSANLPSTAALGDAFTLTANVRDSLGNALTLPLTFTKSGTRTFTLTAGNVTGAGGGTVGTVQEGTAAGPAYQVDAIFASDGTLSGFDTDQNGTVDSTTAPGLVVASPTTGAADLTIALNVTGSAGGSGLTQYGSNFTPGFISADGARYGQLSGINVSEAGTVSATFSNGSTRAIAEIPVATFTNPDGLQSFGGNLFGATDASGAPVFGTAGGGSIVGGALELSTTDLSTEIVNLILAEVAYKASASVLRTADELSRTLVDIRG